MKKNSLLQIAAAAICLLATACNKYDDISTPNDFNVTTIKQTYKVGDSVIFNFSSGPDFITFYSGEAGRRYENRTRVIAAGNPKLVFQTAMQNGILLNNDSLQLLVSSNLSGYDSASIVRATWTDITARNTKWPTTLTTTFSTSDSIDLTDFNSVESINIAFRAIGKKYPTAVQRRRQIQNLTLTNILADGTRTPLFSTFANTGWVQASLLNNTLPGFNAWNVGTGNISAADSVRNSNGITIRTAYPIQFDPGTTFNNDDNDDWLITSKVNLKTVNPDQGVTIKNETNTAFTGLTYDYYKTPGVFAQYLYFFRTPGVYNITFVGTNINMNKRTEVIKQLQITIVP